VPSSDPPKRPSPRLFVTIGASHYPFDRLLGWIDAWLRTPLGAGVHCLAQHGTSPPPAGAECHPYLGFDAVEAAFRQSELVVCHGGPGTIMLARQFGLKPIVVPRVKAYGECVDDHQISFARLMAARGDIELAETQDQLRELMDGAVEQRLDLRLPTTNGDVPDSVRRFEVLVDELLRRSPRGTR
jgi:UDP-N-acetylglucosamine transferase subunit ALG13